MASIIVVGGPNKGDYYPMAGKRHWTVGRRSSCDIQVVDDGVSRDHFAVDLDEGGTTITVRDLESSQGTLLNGKKLTEPTQATDGAVIGVGKSSLLFTTKDFPNRESALKDQHLKRWFGEDHMQTIVR